MKWIRSIGPLFLSALACLGAAQTGVLHVEVGSSRASGASMELADTAVRKLTRNVAARMSAPIDTLAKAGRWHNVAPLSLPSVVRLTSGGKDLPPAGPSGRAGGLTLEFDSSGARTFPPVYQQLLVDTFTQCESTLNAVFGAPSVNGTVHVRSYDADIGDRHAVSGGYYVDNNGSGEREIRFPVYQNQEAAAVNFVHCLLLAYLGPKSYAFDAFQEGLVRAAAMRVVRTPGAMPATLDADLIAQVLENTYDVGTWYEWNNQRALGGPTFIAPNLVSVDLPPGGSIGGIYLLRYKMSGSAWQKIIAEYPAFIKQFNQAFYADTSIANDRGALFALGQTVLDTISGTINAQVEGLPFATWARRQFILETGLTLGRKLLVEPIPLAPDSGTSDFGVYLVQATFFETLAGGNETLLSGVSYPIFWSEAYDRIFPSAQEDRMDIAGAYGAVVPNLPDLHAGSPYRCEIDIPVQDRNVRCFVPAGGVATGSNPTPNDFYGTVSGVQIGSGDTLRVRVTMGATVVDNIAVTFGAFGKRINTSEYLGYQKLFVELVKTSGASETVVLSRTVNKGPGPLALDLIGGGGEASFGYTGGLPKGLSAIGFPVDPFDSLFGDVIGIPDSTVLAARWNGSKARYDIYPDGGGPIHGNGYFVRLDAALPSAAVAGRSVPGTPASIALRPGWNLIANPLTEAVPTTRVTVIHSIDFPKTFAEALGAELGVDFFEFVPGPNDAATGAPETGTMLKAASFEPGKAYFVRVLSSEGVSLMFEPASTFGPQGRSSQKSAGVQAASNQGWTMKLTLSQGKFKAESYIGQESGATFGLDDTFDSGLPPSMGGLQLAARGAEPLFRDTRPLNSWSSYKIDAVGLIPGKTYTMTLTLPKGKLKRYEFRDPESFFAVRTSGTYTYTFKAKSASRTFEVRVTPGGN